MDATAPAAPVFTPWGPSHLAVWVFTIGSIVWLVRRARRSATGAARPEEYVLAFILLANHLAALGWLWWRGGSMNAIDKDHLLPLHLCDVAAIIGGIAILRGSRRLAEIVWFWGLAGTLQSLITPVIKEEFPQPEYFIFFLHHAGVVIAAVYLAAGRGFIPPRGAVWRSLGWLQLYALTALAVDHAFGMNYGYMVKRPDGATLMDHLPDPPWHILGLEVVALLFFSIVNIPLIFMRRRRAQAESASTAGAV